MLKLTIIPASPDAEVNYYTSQSDGQKIFIQKCVLRPREILQRNLLITLFFQIYILHLNLVWIFIAWFWNFCC